MPTDALPTRYTPSGVRMRQHSSRPGELNWLLLPVLKLWGSHDRIVSQHGWNTEAYDTPNVLAWEVPDAGHFPWIENPVSVTEAFREFSRRIPTTPHGTGLLGKGRGS